MHKATFNFLVHKPLLLRKQHLLDNFKVLVEEFLQLVLHQKLPDYVCFGRVGVVQHQQKEI